MSFPRFLKLISCVLAVWVTSSVFTFAQDFSLTVEATPATTEGLTRYRFYVDMNDASDRMSAVFGNNEYNLSVQAPAGVFNSPFNSSWNASGINPAFISVFPDLVDDTYATIGLEGPASSSEMEGAADPSVVEDSDQPITPFFLNPGATSLLSNTLTGASYYILNTATNGLPGEDLRVFVMQVTTAGSVSGTFNAQVFPLGEGENQQLLSWTFDGEGTYGGDGEPATGCTNEEACNYDLDATIDDGSCVFPGLFLDCDGNCLNDADNDGVCDELEVGCTDALACNFDASAGEDDGSCDYCSCQRPPTPYTLVVEGEPAVLEGLTTYRFYVTLPEDGDRFSAVFGNNESNLEVAAPAGVYNSAFNSSWSASGINPAFLPSFPELASDSYATIGLDGPASTSGLEGAADPSVVEDSEQQITPFFLEDGATLLQSNTLTGASWYILNTASNGFADANGRVMIMQVTTAGGISGQISYQVFPLGIGSDQQQLSIDFDGEGVFGGEEPDASCGCTDINACNYDPIATYDDDSCTYIIEGDCDCDGSQLDAVGVCGGDCPADVNANGICDDQEDCVGVIDECGVCDGPGAIYDCGCSDIPEGDCDCDGNQLDAIGVCGGDCEADADSDGICDDEDDCIGELDACGICNGPGAVYECGCSEIPEGDCDCEGNQLDALGVCGGGCESDVDDNGVCDDSEIQGCTDEAACNYDDSATIDDESCVFCDCGGLDAPDYTLSVEATPAVQSELMTYRFYVNMVNESDKLSAVYGNNDEQLRIQAPAGIFNSELNASWNASGLASAFVNLYPEMADDSYATIGLTGPASEAGVDALNPELAESDESPLTIADFFTSGGVDLDISNSVGGIWYVAGFASNANAGVEGRVLIMQITSEGSLFGSINAQIFPNGDGQGEFKLSWTFAGEGTYDADGFGNFCGCTEDEAINYDPAADYDDGSCIFGIAGCTESSACNFDPEATLNDGSCQFPEEGFNCDGTCVNDVDNDGVCDEDEVLGCTNPSALNFDAEATEDDGSCEENGCTYELANNYNPAATDDDGSCEFDLADCSCPGDLDGSGLVQLNDLLDFLLVYGTYCDE